VVSLAPALISLPRLPNGSVSKIDDALSNDPCSALVQFAGLWTWPVNSQIKLFWAISPNSAF
jgi:hypothetical protein